MNPVISKQLVLRLIARSGRLALKGIRSRLRAGKPQRHELLSWSFPNLGQKILYKAELHGVLVYFVRNLKWDPNLNRKLKRIEETPEEYWNIRSEPD